MEKDIKKAVDFMIKIANDNSHGYSQLHRNGDPDFDCSSLVGTALNKAGFNVSKNSTTRNLYEQLKKEGFVEIKRGPWKAGDIHLSVGHHVVMSSNEKQIAHASIDEKGGIRGDKKGDQTRKEICIRDYYDKNWTYHLRYKEKKETKKTTKKYAKVVCTALNVRAEANSSCKILKVLKNGEKVEIKGKSVIKKVGLYTYIWQELKDGGYICMKKNNTNYAKEV